MKGIVISSDFCDRLEVEQDCDFLPQEAVEDEDQRKLIMMEVFSLPMNCRIILLAHYYMGFGGNEMASVFDTSPKTAQIYLSIAEVALKWRMEKKLGYELPFTYSANREPMLARLYRKDAEAVVTPEICGRLESFVQAVG